METPDKHASEKIEAQEAVYGSQSRRKKTVILAAIALGVIAAIWLATMPLRKSKMVPPAARKATIRITADGFLPSTLTVKKGTQIVWRNEDVEPHRVAVNPYPVASGAGLDSGTIVPGGSYATTMDKSQALQYHDETKPEFNASIMVQE